MSVQITTAMVDQFKANHILLSQQKESLLRQICRMEDVTGDTMYVERIGTTAAQLIGARHGDTPQIDTPHSRRKLSMDDYNWADLIDNVDRLKILIDPDGVYAQNALMAFNRSIDEVVITALGGAAYSGHTGGTTVNNYDAGECRVVLSDGLLSAAGVDGVVAVETGLTIAKLLTCKQLLDDENIDDSRQRYFITNPYNINQLLNTTEVKSSDYNTVKALAQGQLDSYLGFKFIKTTLLNDGPDANEIQSYAVAQDAIVLAIAEEPTVRISERDDKNYSTQIYVEMSLGATRVEGPAVIEINLDKV